MQVVENDDKIDFPDAVDPTPKIPSNEEQALEVNNSMDEADTERICDLC